MADAYKVTLKGARISAGLNQDEVCDKIGINTGTLINWEKGRTSPKAPQLIKLAELYKCSIDDLKI